MNFNQLTAAAAAAAAGNPGNINMSSFTTAVSNILANSNIDLSQLAGLSQLGSSTALSAAAGVQPPSAASIQTSRHNLQQAHHHRSSGSNSSNAGASLTSNTHLTSSISNLTNADAATAALSIPGLPASLSNLTSSALADLAASAAAAAAHQTQSSGRNSLPSSAHHRSLSSANHHLNHHPSSATLTAAHQSTSAAKALASAVAHQSQNTTLSHHRNSSSHTAHNSSINNNNNNISKSNLASLNSSFSSLASLANLNNLNASAIGNLSNNLNNIANLSNLNSLNNSAITPSASKQQHQPQQHEVGSTHQVILATNNASTIIPPKNSTCFRIGECVYFEASPGSPLKIGKIDEICKTNGDSSNIEVKLVLFFKRCDISSSLMTLAEKYQYDETQEEEIKEMPEKDKNVLRQRELFYSRQIETIPATAIRGKCTVQLLNESESLASYISKEDHYFYTLVYDPQQKTITADRGEIRVGSRYQAEVQSNSMFTPQAGGDPADPRDLNEMETLMYTPEHNLSEDEINKFLTIAKSVGTFARALDCSSSIKQPSLHLTAASASRDVTLLYAMQLLHQNDYDLGKAVCALVPSSGPILCRDEIEEWTAGEATLFEEAIEKYGREFNEIRQDFLPWKSVKNIVEYYYMWKTTDRSIIQRKMKALEAENKVTILYISDPNHELKKSPRNNDATTKTSTEVGMNNSHDSNHQTPSAKKPNTSLGTSSGVTTTSTTNSNAKTKQESDEPTLSSSNPTNEGTNSNLKRRQETEQLRKHTTPGEHIRFIATARYKKMRSEMLTKKQLKHLSRRPWERRGKSKS